MTETAISFGNFGLLEVALICAAVLLLFGARDLAALRAPNATQRTIARRAYFLSILVGLGLGMVVAALAVPTRYVSALLVTVGVACVLVSLGLSHTPLERRLPWDLGRASVSLLSFGITVDAITSFWAP